mmetsp:Transcript_45285/g.97103  ORF Transcript_45285/g.97103 Transcript_45285/m.97103 type:complete len:186 (+) Transcript_45285:306-863(+)
MSAWSQPWRKSLNVNCFPYMDGAFSGEMAPEVRGSSQTYGDRESGIACDRSISVLVDQCCAAIKDRSSTIKSNQRHFRSSLMAALSFGSCGCTCGGCGCGGNGGPPEAVGIVRVAPMAGLGEGLRLNTGVVKPASADRPPSEIPRVNKDVVLALQAPAPPPPRLSLEPDGRANPGWDADVARVGL